MLGAWQSFGAWFTARLQSSTLSVLDTGDSCPEQVRWALPEVEEQVTNTMDTSVVPRTLVHEHGDYGC